MAERSDTDRMMNIGVKVTTRKLGEIEVKELSLEQLLGVTRDILTLLESGTLSSFDSSGDGLKWFSKMLSNPEVLQAIKSVMSSACQLEAEKFSDLPVTDFLRIVEAIKQVHDLEEMKELFFKIVPPKALQNLTEKDKLGQPLAALPTS